VIIYKGLEVSTKLQERVPILVVKFIGTQIADVVMKKTHSIAKVKVAVQTAFEKALDNSWLNELKNNAVAFSERKLYDRDYAGFDMNYYELFPIDEAEFVNPTTLHDTTVLEVYTKSNLKTEKFLLKRDASVTTVKDEYLKKPDFDQSISWQKYRYDNLKDVTNRLGEVSYHHKNMSVSSWPLASQKRWSLSKETPNDFHSVLDSACKYILILQPTLKKCTLMPAMAWKQNYGNWKATRCNIFAGDFSQEALNLNTYPWGTKNWNAQSIHENLSSKIEFVAATWDKAWEYVNLGYPVFITIAKLEGGDAGHIAIGFPIDPTIENEIGNLDDALENGQIVQAGSSAGMKSLVNGFGSAPLKATGKVYVYLGYLNQGI
jgi:hypothetical protein